MLSLQHISLREEYTMTEWLSVIFLSPIPNLFIIAGWLFWVSPLWGILVTRYNRDELGESCLPCWDLMLSAVDCGYIQTRLPSRANHHRLNRLLLFLWKYLPARWPQRIQCLFESLRFPCERILSIIRERVL